MGVMGVVNVYISRNNITIAVVPMVNQTYLKLERASRIESNTESNLSVSVESELQCSHASANESHLGWFKLRLLLVYFECTFQFFTGYRFALGNEN